MHVARLMFFFPHECGLFFEKKYSAYVRSLSLCGELMHGIQAQWLVHTYIRLFRYTQTNKYNTHRHVTHFQKLFVLVQETQEAWNLVLLTRMPINEVNTHVHIYIYIYIYIYMYTRLCKSICSRACTYMCACTCMHA